MTITGDDFAGWTPHRPAWYPAGLPDPWETVGTGYAAGTRYAKWIDGLPDGELARLIAEHRAKVAAGEVTEAKP